MIPILILTAVLSVFSAPAPADTVAGGPTVIRFGCRGADPPIVPVT